MPESPSLAAVLPDTAARALYLAVLREGGFVRAADLCEEDAPALRRLVDLGLLVPQLLDNSYSAVDPRPVADRIGAEIRRTSARLLAEADRIPEQMRDLAHAYDTAPRREVHRTGSRIVTGRAEIRHTLSQLVHAYPNESLAAQPGDARRPDLLDDSLDRTRRYLAGGGVLRSLFEQTSRTDPASVRYAAAATRLGSSIRVLDGAFMRFLVFDRTVAVLPASPDYESAAVVDDAPTVAFVVDTFEQLWRRAEGVNWASLEDGSTEPVSQTQIARLLARGLTQRAVATRLGLSERTVAAHIARLREQHDAETLFQLGWQMRGDQS
ncbi:helix-turn-helix transcriptional regulator [Streptomyces sp. NRRL WC-3742]|uniref:helix-turn-helix transcriptional regulator n=1 Tax=Streptomyces sp. NRRL WC-3742 TaxID=1463934 RepID=UPI0004C7AD1D|nr:LuxR family transcriptional regulator [Streptomyces sp. NRRL WC-3742]